MIDKIIERLDREYIEVKNVNDVYYNRAIFKAIDIVKQVAEEEKSDNETLNKFMNALVHCDTVKVILTGCGEETYTTKEIYEAIRKSE